MKNIHTTSPVILYWKRGWGGGFSLRLSLNVFQKRGLKKTLGPKIEKLIVNWR
jgi:hypothetical protein